MREADVHGLLPNRSKAELAFDALVQIVWGVHDKKLRRTLWRALIRDRSERGGNWRFQVSQLIRRSGSTVDVGHIAFNLITPAEAVRWIESGVSAGRLSRVEANRATEFILAKTNRDGAWKTSIR
jgi:hypothetical protein